MLSTLVNALTLHQPIQRRPNLVVRGAGLLVSAAAEEKSGPLLVFRHVACVYYHLFPLLQRRGGEVGTRSAYILKTYGDCQGHFLFIAEFIISPACETRGVDICGTAAVPSIITRIATIIIIVIVVISIIIIFIFIIIPSLILHNYFTVIIYIY